MTKYQNVLLASDLAQRSDDPVIKKAQEIVEDSGAALTICHILEHRDYPYGTPFVSPNFKEWEKELNKLAQEKLEQIGTLLNVPKDHLVLVSGKAKEKIIEIADQYNADLIIIGNHSGRGEGFVTLGSTAESVIRNAGRDVLSVHITV